MRAAVIAGMVGLSHGATYFASPNGKDSNAGTRDSPVQSLKACVGKLQGPGDECRLRAGRYAPGDLAVLKGVSGTADKRVVIAAAEGEEGQVVIDGSEAFSCDWKKDAQGLWACKTDAVQQLWVGGEQMTPARWPDALWNDRSVFNASRWADFWKNKPWGPFPDGTPDPIRFYDREQLVESKLDATGAIFVGVIAHMDTFAGTVVNHTAGTETFDVQLHVDRIGNSKAANSIYYLENLPAFANQKTEWAYSATEGQLWLNADEAPKDARRKVQTYALEITEAQYVTVANLTFFGTTINAHQEIDYMTWDTVVLNYPSFGKRMLGDTGVAEGTVLSMGKKADGGHLTMRNCTMFGADGPTLSFAGDYATFENNLFDSNDFCTIDSDGHSGLGGWVVDASKHVGDKATRNTFTGNGPSVAYVAGKGCQVELNYFEAEADIQNDGASVQIRSGSATKSTLSRNWALNSAKGWRLDSGSNSAFTPGETNNTIHANVALRTNGFMLKNDWNSYTNNLALWGPQNLHGGNHGDKLFRVDTSRYEGENAHSIEQGNLASSWEEPIAGVTSDKLPNVFYKEVGDELRDPDNLDFRPLPGSNASKAGAGPYAADGDVYWIPGRMGYTASVPIPRDGSVTARADADLMFLGAYACNSHTVYFGTGARNLKPVKTLKGEDNIVRLGNALAPGAQYSWRVDATDAAGVVHVGPVWHFTVRQ
eukprot:TRINITY_DN19_c0_g2_i4.p2 TRINITY_DN19_c0_g2~~TRINITY_DN19_c0_g2_i4.p2  ORF type:complete len:709 (+),score=349.03 TRINITY_DN19_c0_g2_i4:60-2186(+)